MDKLENNWADLKNSSTFRKLHYPEVKRSSFHPSDKRSHVNEIARNSQYSNKSIPFDNLYVV